MFFDRHLTCLKSLSVMLPARYSSITPWTSLSNISRLRVSCRPPLRIHQRVSVMRCMDAVHAASTFVPRGGRSPPPELLERSKHELQLQLMGNAVIMCLSQEHHISILH